MGISSKVVATCDRCNRRDDYNEQTTRDDMASMGWTEETITGSDGTDYQIAVCVECSGELKAVRASFKILLNDWLRSRKHIDIMREVTKRGGVTYNSVTMAIEESDHG